MVAMRLMRSCRGEDVDPQSQAQRCEFAATSLESCRTCDFGSRIFPSEEQGRLRSSACEAPQGLPSLVLTRSDK
jgi:hypothetical protein